MSAEREIPAEDSIRVVCRFRPLNDSEEKAGSKFIVKFPNNQEENCISIAVSIKYHSFDSYQLHLSSTWHPFWPEYHWRLFVYTQICRRNIYYVCTITHI